MELNKVYLGDCLELMKNIPDKSVDLILADLPYGVTKNKWDSPLDLKLLWAEYERIIRDNGAIILFGQDKFSARLMLSNEKLHRYNIIWQKTGVSSPFNAEKMPLRSHEDILVFYKSLPTYNPQKTTGHPRKVSLTSHGKNDNSSSNYGKTVKKNYDSTERYPRSVWTFKNDKQKSSLHPNQKPLDLTIELIKTYSNEADIVLDNVCGSGTTGEGCQKTNRNFILMEKDPEIFQIACKRVGQEF